VDRSHRLLSNLLLVIHPLAQFLSSVLVNNFDLIFITVVVRQIGLIGWLGDQNGFCSHVRRLLCHGGIPIFSPGVSRRLLAWLAVRLRPALWEEFSGPWSEASDQRDLGSTIKHSEMR
jgi:hypothetical protein